jgi:hypothetical protein
MVLFKEKQCFILSLHFSTFEKEEVHPHENTECHAVYLSVGNSILIEKLRNKVLGPPDSTTDSFLPRHTVLVPLS